MEISQNTRSRISTFDRNNPIYTSTYTYKCIQIYLYMQIIVVPNVLDKMPQKVWNNTRTFHIIASIEGNGWELT